MARFKLVDVDSRLNIKYCKVDGIFNWGADNSYPQLVKTLINSSVTAKQCAGLNAKYIAGKGFNFAESFSDQSQLIINKRGQTINDLLSMAAKEFAEQNNLFFHLNINAAHEVTSVTLLPSTDVRIGKADSTGYSGKYIIYDNWDKNKGKNLQKSDFQIIDKFNLDPAVIDAQVHVSGGWGKDKYKGQILHVNSDFCELYSLSDIDSVLFDADTERELSQTTNNKFRRGFHGTKLIITKPFEDEYEKSEFEKTLAGLKGESGLLLMETDGISDDLDSHIRILNMESNVGIETAVDALACAKNIRKAFGVPAILVEDSDNSIFGNSGELLLQARRMFWDDMEEERNKVSRAFQSIFSKFYRPINPNNDWSIKPIIDQKIETNE